MVLTKFDFEESEVYQRALDYIDFVYGLTRKFPKVEFFNLTIIFIGAAQAIALNIGEASGGTKTESIHFLKMAGSSVKASTAFLVAWLLLITPSRECR